MIPQFTDHCFGLGEDTDTTTPWLMRLRCADCIRMLVKSLEGRPVGTYWFDAAQDLWRITAEGPMILCVPPDCEDDIEADSYEEADVYGPFIPVSKGVGRMLHELRWNGRKSRPDWNPKLIGLAVGCGRDRS